MQSDSVHHWKGTSVKKVLKRLAVLGAVVFAGKKLADKNGGVKTVGLKAKRRAIKISEHPIARRAIVTGAAKLERMRNRRGATSATARRATAFKQATQTGSAKTQATRPMPPAETKPTN